MTSAHQEEVDAVAKRPLPQALVLNNACGCRHWCLSSALGIGGEAVARAVRDVQVHVPRVSGYRTRGSYSAQQRLDQLTDPRGRLGAPADDLLVV